MKCSSVQNVSCCDRKRIAHRLEVPFDGPQLAPAGPPPVFLSAPHLCALQKSYRHVNKTRHFILYSKQQCKLSCAIAIHICKFSLFMGKNKQTNMQKNKPTSIVLFIFLHYFIMLLLYFTFALATYIIVFPANKAFEFIWEIERETRKRVKQSLLFSNNTVFICVCVTKRFWNSTELFKRQLVLRMRVQRPWSSAQSEMRPSFCFLFASGHTHFSNCSCPAELARLLTPF